MFKSKIAVILIFTMMFSFFAPTAEAKKLKNIFKSVNLKGIAEVVGIMAIIKQFGDEINKMINKLASDNGAAVNMTTKVVPIFTFEAGRGVSSGAAVGAAQVGGDADKVKEVQAVYAIDTTIDKGKRLEIQIFVPSRKIDPLKLDRVNGVGVTGIIDYKVSKK